MIGCCFYAIMQLGQ